MGDGAKAKGGLVGLNRGVWAWVGLGLYHDGWISMLFSHWHLFLMIKLLVICIAVDHHLG